ncbi:hypothetical protein [Pimelobacter simplex]|uniref:hypothetical protein n=1 Tax=Nocardioides simplex TaxID=2045 RepID=UPI003AACD948
MATEQDPLFSITRSLWDRVTPDLRGVAYEISDSALRVRFVYAVEPDVQTVELVSEAETECIADFWQSHEVSYFATHLPNDQPRDLEPGERWVFLRYEPPRPV